MTELKEEKKEKRKNIWFISVILLLSFFLILFMYFGGIDLLVDLSYYVPWEILGYLISWGLPVGLFSIVIICLIFNKYEKKQEDQKLKERKEQELKEIENRKKEKIKEVSEVSEENNVDWYKIKCDLRIKFDKIYNEFMNDISKCPNCEEKLKFNKERTKIIPICEFCGYNIGGNAFENHGKAFNKGVLQLSEICEEYGVSIPIKTLRKKFWEGLLDKLKRMNKVYDDFGFIVPLEEMIHKIKKKMRNKN